MKILVIYVINSSRHIKCFVQHYINMLSVSKSLTRLFEFHRHKQLLNITPYVTFYDIDYIYYINTEIYVPESIKIKIVSLL